MEKYTDFKRDTIEVCRNCKSTEKVPAEKSQIWPEEEICPVCGGSGLIEKHIEGFIEIRPHRRT